MNNPEVEHNYSCRDILDYIVKNRGTNNAFKSWHESQILVTVHQAAEDGLLLFYVNKRHAIDGVIVMRKPNPASKSSGTTLWITGFLTTNKEATKLLIKRGMALYPSITHAAGYRDGGKRIQLYSLKTLCRILKIS